MGERQRHGNIGSLATGQRMTTNQILSRRDGAPLRGWAGGSEVDAWRRRGPRRHPLCSRKIHSLSAPLPLSSSILFLPWDALPSLFPLSLFVSFVLLRFPLLDKFLSLSSSSLLFFTTAVLPSLCVFIYLSVECSASFFFPLLALCSKFCDFARDSWTSGTLDLSERRRSTLSRGINIVGG